MLLNNPNVSYRLFGFRGPLSSRFGVANLDICPNVVDSIDKPEGPGVCFTRGNLQLHNHFEYRRS